MQRAAFAAAGIEASYEAFDIAPDALAETLRALYREGFAGLNVTAPLKERAWPHLAGATPEATRVRSVNTLIRREDGWLGDATDGAGFAAWADEAALSLRGARVAILGAGGTARAIAPYVTGLGAASLVIAARDARRAVALAASAASGGPESPWKVRALSDAPGEGTITLLIRAISAGGEVSDESPWWRAVAPGGTVVDLNYGALAAESRARAAALGLRFEDGRGMLVHQGALAFARWTGRRAPLAPMRRALEEATG